MVTNSNTTHFFLTALLVLMFSYPNNVVAFSIEINSTDITTINDIASYTNFLNNEAQNHLVIAVTENDSEEFNDIENKIVGDNDSISVFGKYHSLFSYENCTNEDLLIIRKKYILYKHLKAG